MKLILMLIPLFSLSLARADVQKVTMKNGQGEVMGMAILTPLRKGVKVEVDVHGLKPGEHAIHFHEKASCLGPKFESAGGHFNPTKTAHGFDSSSGPHAGDMPNFFAAKDGTAKFETVNTNVSLGSDPDSLRANGSALVIHEKADDFKSQPAGEAGARVACGEIR